MNQPTNSLPTILKPYTFSKPALKTVLYTSDGSIFWFSADLTRIAFIAGLMRKPMASRGDFVDDFFTVFSIFNFPDMMRLQ